MSSSHESMFDSWNVLKKTTNVRKQIPGFKEREIWFMHMGKNVGFEQDGKGGEFLRPVLILKKFNTRLFWGIPMTGTKKMGMYYMEVTGVRNQSSSLILSQLRLFDAKRLKYPIGKCTEAFFQDVRNRIKALVDGLKLETPARAGEAFRRL